MRRIRGVLATMVLAITAAPVAHAKPSEDETFARMLAGQSALQGRKLEKAIREADAHPLGSEKNPVRVTMPEGEKAYLGRLRCSDGSLPKYKRSGSTGAGPFGNIMDLYALSCVSGTPANTQVYMDMYHGGFMETRPVPGFAIAE